MLYLGHECHYVKIKEHCLERYSFHDNDAQDGV